MNLSLLQQKIVKALADARKIGAMQRSQDARQLWHQLYPELTAEKPGLYGAVVGRGEAQTLRLSMLYALLDGVGVIDVPHLTAATAVWRYCETSARMIFAEGQGDTGDPLEKLLLLTIRQEPGINRRGLHRTIGGRLPAKEIVQALARLRDRGQVRFEIVQTGGRPSECWFPEIPSPPIIIPPLVTIEADGEAPQCVAIATPDPLPPPPNEAESTPSVALNLSELFDAVTAIGGKFCNHGQGVVVEAPAGTITPRIMASLPDHQAWLAGVYPPTASVIAEQTPLVSSKYASWDDFFAKSVIA